MKRDRTCAIAYQAARPAGRQATPPAELARDDGHSLLLVRRSSTRYGYAVRAREQERCCTRPGRSTQTRLPRHPSMYYQVLPWMVWLAPKGPSPIPNVRVSPLLRCMQRGWLDEPCGGCPLSQLDVARQVPPAFSSPSPLAAEATQGKVCSNSEPTNIPSTCMYMDGACCSIGIRCNFPVVTRRVVPNLARPRKKRN